MLRPFIAALLIAGGAVSLSAQTSTPAKRKPQPTPRKATASAATSDSASKVSATVRTDSSAQSRSSTTSRSAGTASGTPTNTAATSAPTSIAPATAAAGTSGTIVVRQTDTARLKWWGELDGGIGSQKFSCSVCAPDRTTGAVGEIAGGLVVHRGLQLGAHVALFRGTRENTRQEIWRFGPALRWNPNPRSPFQLRASVDLLHYRSHPLNEQTPNPGNRVKSNSVSLAVGAAFELPVTSGIAIAPFGDLIAGASADIIQGSTVQRAASTTVLQVGLAIRSR